MQSGNFGLGRSSQVARLLNLLPRPGKRDAVSRDPVDIGSAISGYSIEVMPRTAAKIENFHSLLPEGTRVYVAHIEGTPIEDMVATVKRIAEDGFPVMPHVPARLLTDRAMLDDWLIRYRDAGARQALVLGGGLAQPRGDFQCSMQLLETGSSISTASRAFTSRAIRKEIAISIRTDPTGMFWRHCAGSRTSRIVPMPI